jgi:hypothetical protein
MEDGLFQLIFFLIIVIASIVDAIARNRRKRGRIEEMEKEEAQEGAEDALPGDAEVGPGAPRPQRRKEPALEGRSGSGSAGEGVSGPRGREMAEYESPSSQSQKSEKPERDEETADRMVPADLWAILTGQPPPGPKPAPQPAPPPEDEAREPDAPRPAPPQPSTRDRPAPAPAGRGGVRTEPAGKGTQPRSWRRPSASPPVPSSKRRPVPDDLDDVFGTLEEPWGDIPDIREGEISDDGESTDRSGTEDEPGKKPHAPRPQGTGSLGARSQEWLRSGNRDDLRKAIVLREVLGPPVGSRGSPEPWDEDR